MVPTPWRAQTLETKSLSASTNMNMRGGTLDELMLSEPESWVNDRYLVPRLIRRCHLGHRRHRHRCHMNFPACFDEFAGKSCVLRENLGFCGKIRYKYVLLIVSLGMTPPEAMLWFLNLSAFFAVNLCRVFISTRFSKQCNCSDKSLEKPVQSTGTASQVHNLFGPELVSTQGDIAEADVFNVTWT
jgi:hypothetical protein